MQCSQFWMAAAHLHLGQGGFRGMRPCLQAQILRKVGLSSSYMEEKKYYTEEETILNIARGTTHLGVESITEIIILK